MVARSTTQGTPVKSCMITRAGVNWISTDGSAVASQPASARTWSAVMFAPVLGAQQVLEQDLEAVGKLLGALDGVERIDLVVGAADLELLLRGE